MTLYNYTGLCIYDMLICNKMQSVVQKLRNTGQVRGRYSGLSVAVHGRGRGQCTTVNKMACE